MAVFKCKMCGGTIEFEQGATVGICDSCGTKQTLPRLDDEGRVNLYDRANHFRRNNEYDKAEAIYEKILMEDTTDAEAYWSLVLCQYGIEYVEEPGTHKRIPTVNRAQFTSIFDDNNYKSAIKYADGNQREVYEEEAKIINDIQKGILSISQKEDPFDVFICYKETDNNGRRTPDSVLANDLYHQLTQEGFKVFFSRITLEDKLGTAYEPYIFAALNSSKVMVVLGTKPENFNSVWVKNEWSRYLALVKNSGGKKVLIPAYKDMDPYDLPEEFSHLQAQDMSKLGFMQDLIRGINKIAKEDESKYTVKESVVVSNDNVNAAPLLERVFLFLEDGKWQEANIYCEKVLDIDPKNSEAYLGKLMSDLHVRTRERLVDCAKPFDNNENYRKVFRFGDVKLVSELQGYIDYINERNENVRLNEIYDSTVSAMKEANSEEAFKEKAEIFRTISGFKDADSLVEQCLDKAEVCRKDAVYESGRNQMNVDSISGYEEAINTFRTILGWKDTDEQIYACQIKIEELKVKEEKNRLEAAREAEERRIALEKAAKKRKKVILITTSIVIACIIFLSILITVIIPKNKYNSAISLIEEGKYVEAYDILIDLDGYKDSAAKTKEIYEQYKAEKLKTAKVGDYVVLGYYEQDNNTSNGKEEIEWLVLAKEGNKVLIISRYALDCQAYTKENWEDSSLRKWLNKNFIDNAFSSDEQNMIQTTTVIKTRYKDNNTNDRVFLLSKNEALAYFDSNIDRQCQGTAYCYAQGSYKGENGNCFWWLRDPYENKNSAASVWDAGCIGSGGKNVEGGSDFGAVRPALWIDVGF